MDVLDPAEVPGHGNKVPGGPSSAELASLFVKIFARYPTASAIGFATIPSDDPGAVSLAAVNRMIEGAVRGVIAREGAARTPAPRDQSVKKPASSRRKPGSTTSPSTPSLSRSSSASPPGR
jgi:hypothetical protein